MSHLITGGAGFIGCNLAHTLLSRGERVTVLDNLSRPLTPLNLEWLQRQHGERLRFIQADIRDAAAMMAAIPGHDVVYHLAGQVAVTTSVADPRSDFEINALGTLNVLEAARQAAHKPIVFFASTNKVYGGMETVAVELRGSRYAYRDLPGGVPEHQLLDFHSPYGCCYSADTDILTRAGWKRFYDLSPDDEVLTYSIERKVAEFQRPTNHFAFPYQGKMYVQHNRRLQTCVTPNHKMLVAWDCNHDELENPRLIEAEKIAGKPMAYLLAADVEAGADQAEFVLPAVKAGKHKHFFPARVIPMRDWLRFLGWYLAEGHCSENQTTGNCTVTLTTYYRTDEAVAVMKAVGLTPVIDKHHVTAASRQMYEYLCQLGKSHDKCIPPPIKALSSEYLRILLHALLDGDGNQQSKHSWRYTTVSRALADDVQEIAIRCGMATSVAHDQEGFYRVSLSTTRTAQCNLGENRSEWIDYEGMVYCVEVPNSVVMVRQSGHAYFSGNSKGAADQYVRDYARIYGLQTVVFRQSCLAAGQPVLTPFGHKPISALRPGDIVHSGYGWTRVRKAWQTGIKPVRRITTMNGLSLTLTPDHRVVRPHGLFTNQTCAYGDFLAVLPESKYAPDFEPLPDAVLDAATYLAAVRAKTSDQRCINEAERVAESLLPLRGERLLAVTEIVGRLFGEGHLGVHTREARDTPAYSVQHFGKPEELDEVARWMGWLGLPTPKMVECSSESTLPSGHVVKGTSYRIQQQSIPVFTLFELLGVPVGDKVRVAYGLPAWVAGGHRLVKRAFLRGFFGAELCKVSADSYLAPSFAQAKDLAYLESGRAWIAQLRNLIAEFGIETSVFEAQPITYKRGTTVQTTVRLLGGAAMFQTLAAIGYAFSAERSRQLNALLRWQWGHTTPEHFERAVHLYAADGQLFWDSLAMVEELDEQPVYDLEVEHDAHLFVAGGVQISNCIYGPRQFGVEDQGWAAHFVIAAVMGRPISIYGDGKQVRDMLYIDDLVGAYMAALERIGEVSGQIYNVGGGPDNSLSIWAEFGPLLERLTGNEIQVRYGDWRPGDQPVYISDISKAAAELGWRPQVGVAEGIERLVAWVQANREAFEKK